MWKQIKRGSIGFSIGFMATKSREREGGKGRELLAIDLLEVSAVSTPMHPGTRALDWKSTKRPEIASPDLDAMGLDELRDYAWRGSPTSTRKSRKAITIATFEA